MRKKLIILGLVLFLVGSAVLIRSLVGRRKERRLVASYKLKYASEADEYLKQYNEWSKLPPEQRTQLPWGLDKYGQTKTKSQLCRERQERLKADLDKLAAGEKYVYPFANILYGENWQEEVSKFKKQKKMRELTLTGSTVCMLAGAAIPAGYLLSWTAALMVLGLGHFKNFSTEVLRQCKEAKSKILAGADATKDGTTAKALIKSGWQNFNNNDADRDEPDPAQTAVSERSEPCVDDSAEDTQKIAVLLSDEKSVETKAVPNVEDGVWPKSADCNTSQKEDQLQNTQKTALLDSPENSIKLEDSLETQTEDFEKQVQEIKQMAQKVQQAAVEHSGPLNNTLAELTQQVAAIREYASHQQDRVKKLQEGYDWNIIKTFCLRVIRCVDNLENRISRLSEQDVKTSNLEEIRDELIFALESSGVERFEPEINSDYRGQEKAAEAVKEKEHCDDLNLTGKIAKIIRPGYQYFIDEENVKVVRVAQVKLFGSTSGGLNGDPK
jgi:molecular chaperone GrpE (heat shock protein)